MADPLTGIPTGTEAGDDATALDYLGRRAPMALQAQPALPVGGPATGVGSGPTLATGTGPTGGRSQTAAGGPTGSSGMTAQIAQWLRGGATLAEIAAKIAGRSSAPLPSGMVPGDTIRPIGPGQADIFRDAPAGGPEFTVPRFSAPAPTGPVDAAAADFTNPMTPGAGDVGGAAATEGQLGAGASTGASASLGKALPYAGAALNIGLEAAAGKKPEYQQAVDAAADVVAAYFAPETFGASMLASQLFKHSLDTEIQALNRGDDQTALLNVLPVVGFANDAAALFGAPFLGGEPEVNVQVPGYSHPIKQTAGGAKTSQASYEEGIGGAQGFAGALGQARSADDLVRAINQPWSPHAGQFRIDATTSAGERISNLGPGWGSRAFRGSDLSDPAVVASLTVQAGAMGAPADQPGLADALRKRVQALQAAAVPTAVPPPLPAPAPVSAPTAAVSPGGGGLVELAQVLQA